MTTPTRASKRDPECIDFARKQKQRASNLEKWVAPSARSKSGWHLPHVRKVGGTFRTFRTFDGNGRADLDGTRRSGHERVGFRIVLRRVRRCDRAGRRRARRGGKQDGSDTAGDVSLRRAAVRIFQPPCLAGISPTDGARPVAFRLVLSASGTHTQRTRYSYSTPPPNPARLFHRASVTI